jgi:O-antigen/teichoic acid export membrane protein
MLRNLLHTFTTRILSAACAFGLVVLSSQYLGAEGRGYVGLVVTSIANVLLLNGFIGGPALVYLLPQHKNRAYFGRVLVLTYVWTFGLSTAMTGFFYATAMVPQDQLTHIYLLSMVSSVTTAHGFIFVAYEQIPLFNLTALFQIVIQITLFSLVILVKGSASVPDFIMCLYAGFLFSFIYSSFYIYRLYRNCPDAVEAPSWRMLFAEVGQYGFISQLGNVLQYLNYRLSYYVLHYQHNLSDIGLYDIGIRLAEAVWMISNSISTVLYSRIANLGDNDISRRLTLHLAKLSFLAVLLAVLVLCFLPNTVFTTIFGAEFSEVRGIVRMLSVGIVMFGFSTVVSHYFAGTGRYHLNTIAAFMGLIITLAGNLYLIPRLGLAGAGWTASISYFFTALFLVVLFLKKTRYQWFTLVPTWRDLVHVKEIFKNRM